MRNIFSNIFKMIVFASIFIILTSCNYKPLTVKATVTQPVKLSAWLAYWDLDAGVKDLARIEKKLEKLSYFGAYFDSNDRLIIPQELSDKKKELKNNKGKYETYLTFVNDKQNPDGSFKMKDIEVLWRIFTDNAALDRHIEEIVALTLQGGYDGVEIDYERIWKDEATGKYFFIFSDKLYKQTLQNNLKLRIVLEPNTPFSSAKFVNGPEYVVMLYNLYGLHSKPGPKANKDFIEKIIRQMQSLPDKKSVAFSTGGCLWSDKGEIRFLTEMEVIILALTYDAETKRDKESQCVVLDYSAEGINYQIWYADVETLTYWISIAGELGENNISLWRLGGNVDIDKIN